ncbi:MAG: hypothetical protein AAF846_22900 [Chloroflexota bacterium]
MTVQKPFIDDNYDPQFKFETVIEFIKGKPIEEICEQRKINQNQLILWKNQLFENGSRVFREMPEDSHSMENVADLVNQIGTLRERLAETHQLALIGLFYGEDMHYLANVLGSARAFLRRIQNDIDAFLRDSSKEKTIKNVLKNVSRDVSRVDKDINRLLDLTSRINKSFQMPEMASFNLSDVLKDTVFNTLYGKDIQIIWEIDTKERFEVSGPILQVSQVLRVILHNSKMAMEGSSGVLTINIFEDSDIFRSYYVVSITNTGNPPLPQDVENMFTIGNKSRNNRGFSFGTAWARLFMRRYGGDIEMKVDTSTTNMLLRIPKIMTQTDI